MRIQGLRNHARGFTLVEVAVVVPILIVVAITLFDFMYALVESSSIDQAQINLVNTRQLALSTIEDDTTLTSSYLAAVPSPMTDPYPPTANGGAWSYRGESATSRTLMLRALSTTTNPQLGGANGRQPVFVGDPNGSACSPTNVYFNDVHHYAIIYFVSNQTLYRRRLTDTTTQLCNPGQYQKQSCPTQADLTAQNLGPRNVICKADDEVIASNVSGFAVNYYSDKDATVPLDVYASGDQSGLVTGALDVEITLTVSQKVLGKTVTSSSTQRLSRLNTENG